ncbi:MAG: leucine-rich repeat domain-containing protein, partial [Duncaniella sp.]|nr:leucine-rich repeat domain-containing protein [Duncaniella sp.]
IGAYAFYYCDNLTSVTIPNSVTFIGHSAFSRCNALSKIIIPNSVTEIGHGAFSLCRDLISVSIDNSATNIGDLSFSSCYNLASVSMGNSVTDIGISAFEHCYGLKSVTIPNSVTSIGERAFRSCDNLTKAEFASIESLCAIKFGNIDANPLFYAHHLYIGGKEVTEVVIPESVTSIGNNTFAGWRSLKSVAIPNYVTSIGSWAFYGCSGLTQVTIGNSVTSIGDYAFSWNDNLSDIIVEASTPPSIEGNTFSNIYDNATLTIPEGSLDAYMSSDWGLFKNIKTTGETGILEVVIDGGEAAGAVDYSAPYEIYNLNGAYLGTDLDTVAPGLYIIRQGGAAEKRIVR